ncbi:DNA-binding protein [Streptomyces sp. NPDC046685]|uniref:DNA-binding protein n=1 Tax=Streptomyces sp. NPDC046685 TaxID=3157202 RepID=UPI0033F28C9E
MLALPRLFRPEEIAAALGCSAWWVKDRARRRLIPFTYVGGAYRFTADHLADIVRLHEERPARATPRHSADVLPQPKAVVAPRKPDPTVPAPRLRARPPRRALKSQYGTAA